MAHSARTFALGIAVLAAGCGPRPAPEQVALAPRPSASTSGSPQGPLDTGVVTPDQVAGWAGVVTAPLLLDVRTPEEFATGRIAGALNIPVGELPARVAELDPHREHGIVTYCRSGRRAAEALAILREAGYSNVAELDGSIERWTAEGRPLEQ